MWESVILNYVKKQMKSNSQVTKKIDRGGAHPLGFLSGSNQGFGLGGGPVGLVSERKEKTRKKEERRGPRTELNCCYYYACLLFCVTKLT